MIVFGAIAGFCFTLDFWCPPYRTSIAAQKALLRYGLPLVSAVLMLMIFTSSDKIMLRSIGSYEQLGLYAAAFKIVGILAVLQVGVNGFWSPMAIRWFEEGVFAERLTRVERTVVATMVLIACGIVLLRDLIIQILAGEYQDAALIIPLLVFAPIFTILSEITMVGINFKKRTELHLIITVVVAALNILGNFILIPKFGPGGAGLSTAASYLLYFWLRTFVAIRVWQRFEIRHFVEASVILVVVAALPFSDFDPLIQNGAILAIMLVATILYRKELGNLADLGLQLAKSKRSASG